jgi:hypothetical protein
MYIPAKKKIPPTPYRYMKGSQVFKKSGILKPLV